MFAVHAAARVRRTSSRDMRRHLLLIVCSSLQRAAGYGPLAAPRAVQAAIGMSAFDDAWTNMKQMTDRAYPPPNPPTTHASLTVHAARCAERVARISHVMLRTDEAALNMRTAGEAYELLLGWKEVSV